MSVYPYICFVFPVKRKRKKNENEGIKNFGVFRCYLRRKKKGALHFLIKFVKLGSALMTPYEELLKGERQGGGREAERCGGRK